MGHGGYVAGLFARRAGAPGPALQVTLRRPTPLDTPLELVDGEDGRQQLLAGGEVTAEAEPTTDLDMDVPTPPTFDQARASESASPSHFNTHGVHPTCFGCGNRREVGDALRIFAGPVEAGPDGPAVTQVAGVWRPADGFAEAPVVDPQWVLASLDCAGAFAFIVDDKRAGLLGRIVYQQYADVTPHDDLLVTGWQIGHDGRKLFAGTALTAADGTVLAKAKATWFSMQPV